MGGSWSSADEPGCMTITVLAASFLLLCFSVPAGLIRWALRS